MKTLFISDLDGTLLNPDAILTVRSRDIINSLAAQGLNFTVATARSPWTVGKIIAGLNVSCPAVLLNGVCVYDLKEERFVKSHDIKRESALKILALPDISTLSGFMYVIEGNELNVYYSRAVTPQAVKFMREREEKFGKRFIRVDSLYKTAAELPGIAYYTVCEEKGALHALYAQAGEINGVRAEFYRDVYNDGLYFLEISSCEASKKSAALFIKESYGYGKIVSFGDNLNDLPLFEASDYKVAVSNARPEVKSAADEAAGSNTEDGVAVWLSENYKKY